MRKLVVAMVAGALMAAACTTNEYVVVSNDGSKVRLEFEADNIVRVSAVPAGEEFSERQSLSVLPQNAKVRSVMSAADDEITVSTKALTVKICKQTGALSFFDNDGNELSSEYARCFERNDDAWTVRQQFNSSEDEGFYGLGQHQADEWNYKGRNEELFQYNTQISVPFIVSSKKYGILWDSYSFCRWGDVRDYAQLGDVFKLYDKNGKEGALTGTYKAQNGQVLVRREKALAQEFLETPECISVRNAPENFRFGGSQVEYDGYIEPSETGLFHFYVYYAGYMKVYLDGEQVTPNLWRTAWNPNGRKFEVQMQKGKKAHLHIDWEPDGDVSYCALKVLSPLSPEEQGRMSWWGEKQRQIDYHFIAADNIDGVIKGYRTLTGKAPIMPKWAMGYWQSRERYTSQDEIVSTLKQFRDRQIPVDNIVQDWQYWLPDQWGSHEFDPARFPDPKAMVDSIHAMNGRYMISVWPKFYEGTEHFDEFDSKGWMYRTPVDDNVIDWLGYRQSFYDAYSEGARELFWQQMKDHLYPLGVDSWWMDASEPNIHDCTDMDYRKAMCGPTALGSSEEYFNAYALMNAQAIYEGQRKADPDRRVFLLTRNGFSGLQRYSTASWSGDISTTWLDMKAQISAGLNYSISGIPFWGQDIGGFSSEVRFMNAQQLFEQTGQVTSDLEEWRELNVRWHQWGAFCPIYRAHGQYPYREPWNINPDPESDTYRAILQADIVRYSLMPYIYTLDARTYFDDYTIMRPLVMDFTDDPVARDISDEYMFGDAFLVCPVYELGASEREVYLPEGGWTEIHTGRYFKGPATETVPAPIGFSPVFCRDGQIIVEGGPVQSTAEEQSTLSVTVFGRQNAKFELYEDDGVSYAYEKGHYSTIPISWDVDNLKLKIGKRQGSFPGMLKKRTIKVFLNVLGTPVPMREVEYDGREIVLEY